MNEQDLTPFDWEKYRTGDGVYYVHEGDYGWQETKIPLKKMESKNGKVHFYDDFYEIEYQTLELRLPRGE